MFPLEALTEAFGFVAEPRTLAFLLLGTSIGLVVGFLPGLGGVVGTSLAIPFLFGMEAQEGIALLVGVIAVTTTSDTFTAVLLGVPGSVASQATVLDGYPMARRGEAARALSAAFVSSMIGGIFGGLALMFAIGAIRPVILALGSPQLFMLSMLGLAMVAILTKGATIPGIMSALAGMGIGLVGMAPSDSVMRFTFGSMYLYDGLPVAVVAIGMFAVPELLGLLVTKSAVAEGHEVGKGRLQGVVDVFRNKLLLLRSSLVGVFVGLIPGLGASVSDWIAYGVAKQTTKGSETFGTGDVRGVIAVESATNSKDGGGLIPTLLFGVPGSALMAVLLTALPLLGLRPGPSMLAENLSTTVLVVLSLIIANIVACALCLAIAPQVARITVMRPEVLVPVLFSVLILGAFQSSRSVGDLFTFMAIGIVGWLFRRLGWPRPPLLIGFALSLSAERYLGRSVAHYGWEWVTDPIVIGIGLVTVLLVVAGARGGGVNTEQV